MRLRHSVRGNILAIARETQIEPSGSAMMNIQSTGSRRLGWTTLDELRHYVVNHGWFSDDFECAIKAVGTEPTAVADWLQVREFQNALNALKAQAVEYKRIENFELLANLNMGGFGSL